ncbi:hypothetical protein Tco_0658183 [Tanacetum coccineum]
MSFFPKEIGRLLEASLEREIRDCVLSSVEQQENEMLMFKMEKISNEAKDIQANLLKRIKILKNDFQHKSKPATSCSTPKNEQGVASSSRVRRPESKDTHSKKRVLLNTKSKSTYKDIKKSQNSSEELNEIPSKEDLDNLFGRLYEEYYVRRTPEVSDNSASNTLNNEDTPSSFSIIIKDHDSP